jgi:hypothetical protein
MMDEWPVFYEWLNEITNEMHEKELDINNHESLWEMAGLRDDAPDHAKVAFQKYVKEEEYWRNNSTVARPR